MTNFCANKRAGFYPTGSLEGKRNYKRLFRVEPDGAVIECVMLRVLDDRLREEIICLHFLRSRTKYIIREPVGVQFLERDRPWDFRVKLSNGEEFYLEITAISDDTHEFIVSSSEKKLELYGNAPVLALSLIRKLHRNFPNARSAQLIVDSDARGLGPDEPLENPWWVQGFRLFVHGSNRRQAELFDLIRNAVVAKAAKKNENKDQTVLVIDNRTSGYDVYDLQEAAQRFADLEAGCPFKEVWFYTGFYSDEDSGNAEWQLVPVLIPGSMANALSER